jgi:alpha-beta hydrolase superfamily lysophospholipase
LNPSDGPVPSIPIEAGIDEGVTLPGRLWSTDRPRAVIALVHGLGEHTGRYAALAGDLVRAGYTVASLDWPGHGATRGRRGDVLSWARIRDRMIDATFAAIPQPAAALPRIVFGHSMGGLMALDYALAHPHGIRAVAVSAPAIASPAPPAWKLTLARVARMTTPWIGFGAGVDPGGISRDPEVVRARDADPLVHDSISPRLYFDLLAARERVLREASRLAVPALVLQGTADTIVDPEGTRRFCGEGPEGRVTCHFYDGAYHEVLNDFGRDRCLADLLAWIAKVAQG